MGKIVKQVTTCTCDMCHSVCSEHDSVVNIPLNSGDGRDVGPTIVSARFMLSIPYGPTEQIICRNCLVKALKTLVNAHEGGLSVQ